VARVVVDVMLKPEILDPQGQAVANALPRLGVDDVTSVRIGRRIEIEFAGEPDLDRAREIADKLLANPVIEDFTLHVDGAGTVTTDSDSQESEPAEAPA
jgi:phosphoribosylformylglycinamidine synthase subunit PurS